MTKHILFCSDEHVLLRRKGVPVDFEKARYSQLFDSILSLSARDTCAAVIHGGDTFDRSPTIQEMALVVRYLNSVVKPTYIISGNHEQVKKETTFLSELSDMVHNPLVTIITDYATYNIAGVDVDFIPFNRLKHFEKEGNIELNSELLVTHVRGEIPPHVKPEVDLSIFNRWKLVLAGDLHSHSNSQLNIVYPGSPLTTSFYRNKPVKGVLSVNLASKTYEFIDLKLPALLRVTTDTPGEKIVNEDYIDYEVVHEDIILGEDIDEESPSFTKHLSRVEALAMLIPDHVREEVIDLYVKITSR